jgi:acetyl esterase/lipase
MLYLKIVPTGTALVGNTGSPFGADTRFWGGIVITDMSEQQTTPAPAGAVFFEAFDKMVGGVDYLLGGQPNGTAKLGGLADAWSKAIGSGSWNAPSATPTAWNDLTCSVVAVRPGYAQIGHTKTQQGMDWNTVDNVIGSIKTPKLAAGNLTVSFKAMMFRCPLIGRERVQYLIDKVTADKIIVNVIGGGTFEDGTTSKTISGVSYSAFNTYTLAVKNATADTQVEFTSPTSVPSTRWFIDDICVMKDGADTDVARTIQVANPNLKIALPKKSASNGKLVIMVPGGGYSGMNLVGDREGEGWASYYNERGFACATLRYTLPAGNCLLPVNDLKNAIKYIRDHATELGVSEIGVHGFSAGGHLASTGATHFTGELRPDFQILFYPVITLRNATHNGSRNKFLGTNPSQYMLDLYSNELQVTKDTPKAFVMYYVPDTVVPQATNGAAYVEALKAKNVPVKTLIYDTCYPDSDTQNGHGWWERDTRIDGKHVKEHLSDWLETL